MPPIDSETPAVELTQQEINEWLDGLQWEKKLDQQREHRLAREGLFWHDERLDGLGDDDRMWEIIKMSFMQVAKVLDSVGLVHYLEYFLQRGILGAKHLRLLTRNYVRTKMPRIAKDEGEAIVAAAAKCMQDEEFRHFEARYGDVDRLVLDCQYARRFLSEKLLHEKWMIDQYDLTAPLHHETNSYNQKWTVPRADFDSFDDHDEWIAATGCDGFLFLWPLIEGDRAPPVVRCKMLHTAPCTDFVMDWSQMRAVTCGIDNKVTLYNARQDKEEKFNERKANQNQGYLCVDADVQQGQAALGTNFGAIKILDLQSGEFILSLLGHQDHCRAVSVDWESCLVVSCSWDSYVHLYDLRSEKLVHRLKGHNSNCGALDVDFGKNLAISSANEYRFILWELRQRMLLATYESPGHNVNCLRMEDQKVATGADDGLVKIWNLERDGDLWESSVDCMHNMTCALDVDWSRKRLATASWDYSVDLWDLDTGRHLQHFFKPRRCMTQVKLKKS